MDNDISVSNGNLKINWAGYIEYLNTTCIENTVKDRYNYSIKYYKYLLDLNTLSNLTSFSPNKRIHTMKALTSLSKYWDVVTRGNMQLKDIILNGQREIIPL